MEQGPNEDAVIVTRYPCLNIKNWTDELVTMKAMSMQGLHQLSRSGHLHDVISRPGDRSH